MLNAGRFLLTNPDGDYQLRFDEKGELINLDLYPPVPLPLSEPSGDADRC